MAIDATKPPLSDVAGRELFERIRPIGLETVKLEDFL
jgi:hypothetical protein